MNPFSQAGLFLVQSLFSFYVFIIILRVILEWVQADFHNPFVQFIAKLTNRPVALLRRIIPLYKGFDLPAVVLLLLVEIVKLIFLVVVQAGIIPNFVGLSVWAFGELLSQLLDTFFFAILAVVILSWISPLSYSTFVVILHRVTDPLLGIARRYIPLIGGLDLSPLAVLIGLKVIEILLAQPLLQIGVRLTFQGFF